MRCKACNVVLNNPRVIEIYDEVGNEVGCIEEDLCSICKNEAFREDYGEDWIISWGEYASLGNGNYIRLRVKSSD